MKLKVFTLRLSAETGAFDDQEMQGFLEDKDVLDVSEHMLTHGGEPVWAFLVRYTQAQGSKRAARPDYRATLNAADQALFDTLRRWRNERAKKDGRPAYVLLTNKQVTALAQQRPQTLAALRAIEGIGDARVTELGEEILALVKASAP